MNSLTLSENYMTTWDGIRLFYRSWLPSQPSDKALILFHRGHEHSGRLQELVELLKLDGFSIFAWDARGNGRSEGPRDYAENFSCYAKDADTFVRYISDKHQIPIENMAILGHSVGAAIVSAWIHDYAPPVRAMVLATPAFRIRLYIPFAIPSLRLAQKLGIMKFVPSYVKAKVLTHDPEQIQKYNEDKMITHSIATNILLDLYDTSTRIMEDASAIQIPALMLMVGKDWVVDISAEKKFFERLGSPVKEMEFYPDFFHAIFHEKDRQQPIMRARQFILNAFQNSSKRVPLIHADREGTTKKEYEELLKPLSLLSPRGICFASLRILLKTVGRLSYGIRLGWESGFNSGRTLDYVYENKAQGLTPIGKMIDRVYLDGIGWRGIRVRKIILERLIQKIIDHVLREHGSVHLVDIATGAGRYMLEAIKKVDSSKVTAHLRDREPKNLDAGRKTAKALCLNNVEFSQGDAFDRKSLSSLSPKPHIAIVSGLYELFPSNDMILESLRGLAEAVPEGGYLIYTNQPWHPQIELIARVLCNWDGEPWIMRRRTQAEIDDLVREAGFEKIDMEIDPWGIFTVSVARRVAR